MGGSGVFPNVEVDPQLAEFCRLEWPRLVGSLSFYTGEPELAEDLAQEALIRTCQHWDQVRNLSSRSGWAHRVAFNLAKSQFRRRLVRRRLRHVELPEPVTDDPDTSTRVAVREAVQRLPEAQRRALVLRYFADLSVSDVAELMGCPTNTVKTHTKRAIEALRATGLLIDEEQEPQTVTAGGG